MAHRREHASRARGSARARVSRLQGADEAVPAAARACRACPRENENGSQRDLDRRTPRSPRTSPPTPRPGFDAIGIWEFKLPEDDDGEPCAPRRSRSGGGELHPGGAVVPAARDPRDGGPGRSRGAGPRRCARRSAVWPRSIPPCVVCLTGPLGRATGRGGARDRGRRAATGRGRGDRSRRDARVRAGAPVATARRLVRDVDPRRRRSARRVRSR